MVSLATPASSRTGLPFRAPVGPLVAALTIFVAILFRTAVLKDGDTYWHLAAGAWMFDHGRIVDRDVFSFTMPGIPWVSHEWLSELIMTGAYRLGGWSGLLVLFAGAAALTAGLLAARIGRSLAPLGVAVVLTLVFWMAGPSLLGRPHVLVLPILVAWLAELLDAREQGRRPSLWLVPAMALWANMHGSFVFGFLLAGAFGLEALAARGADRWGVLREWGLLAVPMALAGAATPHGFLGLVHPFTIMGMDTLPAIAEWKPPNLATFGPLKVALLATLFVCLSRGVRVPLARLALLLLVFHMATQHVRHQPVLAIVGAMLLAAPIGAAFGQGLIRAKATAAAAAAFAACALILVGVRLALPVSRADEVHTPATALARLPPVLADRPGLNNYGFGGYVIFQGHKAFIDGRADMYGDAFMKRYIAIQDGKPEAVDAALCEYAIDWTLVAPTDGLAKTMDARPGWRRVYGDSYAILHVREAALAQSSDQSQAASRTPEESPCAARRTGVSNTSEKTNGAMAAGRTS